MVDLQTILASHPFRKKEGSQNDLLQSTEHNAPLCSEIPDLYFDDILVHLKLGRIDVIVHMYLYRRVWCRPNLYKKYGIGEMLSVESMVHALKISSEDLYSALSKLESLGLIETIRPGQFFVRKYFTQELDSLYGQNYENFGP